MHQILCEKKNDSRDLDDDEMEALLMSSDSELEPPVSRCACTCVIWSSHAMVHICTCTMHAQVPDPHTYLGPEELAELEDDERERDERNAKALKLASQESLATPTHAIKRGVSSAKLLASSASSSSLSGSLRSSASGSKGGSNPGFKDYR